MDRKISGKNIRKLARAEKWAIAQVPNGGRSAAPLSLAIPRGLVLELGRKGNF
ncbi:MAG TPA: hypothetical protein PKH95_03840 [Candidatus Magasanikbacteria bacterium]|jgi:hypothetical protein|nr:hypothetical protein [Candidatus Magasanikbacteria bacterium]